ncbi:addiction module protein [Flavobacterium sp. F372]|uniref:Addiction module protein n=2 Tax=Flavobacterium bernardetii TaxID=2813823 RepID=A0ABR7IZA5_9FLAO|nr:addiction module protein [Flavobacterium bernardetii]NHF70750.1 addiction module protein [Flavobacterium bernardetii]
MCFYSLLYLGFLYICITNIYNIMDLATRKYNFIQEVFSIENEIFEKLEKILKKEKTEKSEIPLDHKLELEKRLEEYRKNPENVLNWSDLKEKW